MSLHEGINQFFKQWQSAIKLYRGGGLEEEEEPEEDEEGNNTTAAHFDVLAESMTRLIAFKGEGT